MGHKREEGHLSKICVLIQSAKQRMPVRTLKKPLRSASPVTRPCFNNPLPEGEGRVRRISRVRASEITNCDFKLGWSSARRAGESDSR